MPRATSERGGNTFDGVGPFPVRRESSLVCRSCADIALCRIFADIAVAYVPMSLYSGACTAHPLPTSLTHPLSRLLTAFRRSPTFPKHFASTRWDTRGSYPPYFGVYCDQIRITKTLMMIVRGILTFDGRFVVHRLDRYNSSWFSQRAADQQLKVDNVNL